MLMISLIALLIDSTCSTFSHDFELDHINRITSGDNVVHIETFITEKCSKNGANATFSSLMSATLELNTCVETYFNITKVQEELEGAKSNGSIDEVVMRYCLKYPHIYDCLKNASQYIEPCLNATEQKWVNNILKFVTSLKKQVCLKDGNRVAMFIASGGFECMELKREQIQECISGTIENDTESLNNLLNLVSSHDSRRCESFINLRSCFNKELSTCKDNIPANIIETVFKFYKREFSCDMNNQTSYKFKEHIGIRISVTVVLVIVMLIICYILAKQ